MVTRINSKLKALGGWLLPKVSSAVVQLRGNTSSVKLVSGATGCPIKSISGTDTGPSWQFMLGLFDDNKSALLVNQDSNHPALATLGMLPERAKTMLEVDGSTGGTKPVHKDPCCEFLK